jgi:hypothetical protein
MKRLRNNGLSVVFFILFIISIVGQAITGFKVHNQKRKEQGGKQISMMDYLASGHFVQATFENWESEFLQMASFVILSMFLYQKGSSESKDPDAPEEVERYPDPKRKDVPWPVKKGGIFLSVYKNSLSYALSLIFLLCFLAHWYGSMKDYNEEQALKRMPAQTAFQYLSNSRLWFESFQNWESEFLSVFAIVVLSVFLRQKGSPQSKPVDAPDTETGE